MNILHTETLGGWGGQQNKVIKELAATRDLGHTAYLLCNPETAIGDKAREMGFQVFEYPMNKLTYHKSIPYALRLIKELEIDILITHSSSDSWMGGIAGRLSSRKVKTVRERHNMHTIVGWPSKWLHRSLFHHVLAISDTIRDYLVDTIGVSPEKMLSLPSVVDVEQFDRTESTIREELNIPRDAFVFGMFSILRVNKGIYDFLEVIKHILPKYPNAYAIYGGKTNDNRIRELKEKMAGAGVDMQRVRWTHFREDAANVIKGYDVFVFPSHSEGLGTVLLEAMAARLPLIAYDKRPMSDLVRNGCNGFTVPFGDTKMMAEQVEALLLDSDLRKRCGANSYEFVTNKYDQKHLGRNIETMLGAVIDE